MEKYLSLNQEETTALLEMSLFTYMDNFDDAASSALGKLGDLWREFCTNQVDDKEIHIAHKISQAA